MTERDTRIRELYEAALKKPIGERASFVERQAGGDLELRRQVEALLGGQQETQLPGYEPATGALLETGTLIGSYRIDGPLGAGGMGVVYRATDTKLHRPAAIKVLPETLADPEARRRFQREAQLASSLNHPHIVTVYDAGEYQERQYLITEYVDGGTLRHWASRPRGWRPIVELLIGVADGIATAHEAGILHRDIKPENILLAKNGYAKLADFGIAKLLEADPLADDAFGGVKPGDQSSLIGTAAYMSPEQTQGLSLDARSDVYSFGVMLHELLAGSRASGQKEALPPLGEEIPADLRTSVAKALEPEPEDRYQSMRDLVVDLRRLVRRSGLDLAETGSARTGPVAPRRFAEPRLWYFAAGVALLAVLGFATREAMLGSRLAKSIVVLPFVNESGAAEDLPISEGLGDDLRDRLMGVPGLSVQARASSISFRGQDADMPTIAATLGVGRLVNGTLRRRGRTLEVLVEVLDHRGFALQEALRFQGPETGLQAMQQEIALQLSALLVPEASSASGEAPVAPTDASESANMLVLFGARLEHQVKDELLVDETKLDQAIGFYRRATEADPKSVAAHSRLAGALLYKGEVEEASAPLRRARDLVDAADVRASAAELSEFWYTTALYQLSLRSGGADEAYEKAIALNPNHVDARAGYAQWLMTHHRSLESVTHFEEAIRHDVQSLSHYVDYAEYLGIREDMDGVRKVGREIESRFPDARGYRALARLYETTGEIDIGIAWALRAYRSQPNDDDTRGQLGELYARIGEFDRAAEYDPGPRMYQLYYRRRHEELITLAQEEVLDRPEDLEAWKMLVFAYNARGDFAPARYVLEKTLGMPRDEPGGGQDPVLDALYIDTLQQLGEPAALVDLPEASAEMGRRGVGTGMAKSWWVNAYLGCNQAQLGQYAEALDSLERVGSAQGLVWSPLLQDSPCFRKKEIATHPRYIALIEHLEARKKALRDRLPATLLAYEVADVRPAQDEAR